MMISFFRVRENAIAPDRAHPSDAGMDVFFCPDVQQVSQIKGNNVELFDINTAGGPAVAIRPGGNALLPTGLKFGVPHGYGLFVCNRGSMGAKKSLVYGAHVIDSGYSGEVFIDLHNIGTETQVISLGDKIAQLVLAPVIHCIPLEASNEESLYGMSPITISDRGAGMLGSSNTKTGNK